MSGIEGLVQYNYNTPLPTTSAELPKFPIPRNPPDTALPKLPISKFVDENNKTVDSKIPDELAKKHPTLGIEKIKCAFCEVSMHSASNLKHHLKTKHPGVKWLGYACGK